MTAWQTFQNIVKKCAPVPGHATDENHTTAWHCSEHNQTVKQGNAVSSKCTLLLVWKCATTWISQEAKAWGKYNKAAISQATLAYQSFWKLKSKFATTPTPPALTLHAIRSVRDGKSGAFSAWSQATPLLSALPLGCHDSTLTKVRATLNVLHLEFTQDLKYRSVGNNQTL